MRALRQRALALALASITLVACGGPEAKLRFGGRAIPINVAFGGPSKDDPRAPTIPVESVPVPSGLGFVPSPSPVDGLTPLPDPPDPPPFIAACPDPDPLSFPKLEADNSVRREVTNATYPYRVRGLSRVDGKSSSFDLVVDETVEKLDPLADGTYAFRTTSTMLGAKTTIEYSVQPPIDLVQGQIGLAQIVSEGGAAPPSSFRSPKPLKILELRAAPGQAWKDAANDATSGSSLVIDATSVKQSRINACGVPVDAWQVDATQSVVTPTQDLDLVISRWFATQYGGLVVQEVVFYEGRVGLADVVGQYSRTINRDPGA